MWLEQIPKYSFSVDIDQLEQFTYIAYYLIVFSHLLEKKKTVKLPQWLWIYTVMDCDIASIGFFKHIVSLEASKSKMHVPFFVLILSLPQMTHTSRAYCGSSSMKRLGVLLLPRDTIQSQVSLVLKFYRPRLIYELLRSFIFYPECKLIRS